MGGMGGTIGKYKIAYKCSERIQRWYDVLWQIMDVKFHSAQPVISCQS